MLKEFKFIRVDSRLIHGEVILIWLRRLNINSIIIVDEPLFHNVFLSEIFKLAVPPSVNIQIMDEESFIEYCQSCTDKTSKFKRTLVLMKTLDTAVKLCQMGLCFDKLQLADVAMGSSGGGLPEKCIQDEQRLALAVLANSGTQVYYQQFPGGRRIFLTKP